MLLDIIKTDAANDSRYGEWEKQIAEPLLREAGYTVIRWFTTHPSRPGARRER